MRAIHFIYLQHCIILTDLSSFERLSKSYLNKVLISSIINSIFLLFFLIFSLITLIFFLSFFTSEKVVPVAIAAGVS